jgi:hypothetical protein
VELKPAIRGITGRSGPNREGGRETGIVIIASVAMPGLMAIGVIGDGTIITIIMDGGVPTIAMDGMDISFHTTPLIGVLIHRLLPTIPTLPIPTMGSGTQGAGLLMKPLDKRIIIPVIIAALLE